MRKCAKFKIWVVFGLKWLKIVLKMRNYHTDILLTHFGLILPKALILEICLGFVLRLVTFYNMINLHEKSSQNFIFWPIILLFVPKCVERSVLTGISVESMIKFNLRFFLGENFPVVRFFKMRRNLKNGDLRVLG